MVLAMERIWIWIWRTRASTLGFFRILFVNSFVLCLFWAGEDACRSDVSHSWLYPPALPGTLTTISFFPLFCIESFSRFFRVLIFLITHPFSCINLFEHPSLFWIFGVQKKRNIKASKKEELQRHVTVELQHNIADFKCEILFPNFYFLRIYMTLFFLTESFFRNGGSFVFGEDVSLFFCQTVHSSW